MSAEINRRNWDATLGALLMATVVLLFLNPYTGIRHDAMLYLGQALLIQDPGNFSQDLFFRYGSQASFTVFPRLVALLLDRFSPGNVFLWGTLLARVFFAACCWVLIRATLPQRLRFVSLLAVLALPSGYGAYTIFKYGESFLTARPFAEALTLLALAALIRKRYLLAGAVITVAALLHPLQALPGMLIAWLYLASIDRRWLHLAWGALPLLGLALLGVGPFAALTHRFDAEWFKTVGDLNDNCFMLKWPARDWLFWIADLYLLFCLARSHTPILSRLAGATFAGMLIASLATVILADGLHLVIPAGLQFWRVQWLGHWIAMTGLPFLLLDEYRRPVYGRTQALLLIATVLVGAPTGFGAVPWAVLPLAAMHFGWPYLAPRVSASIRFLVTAATGLAIAGQLARFFYFQFLLFARFGYRTDLYRIDVIAISHPLVISLALGGALLLWTRKLRYRPVMLVTLAIICVYAGSSWDARSNWSRNVESSALNSSLFGVEIQPGTQVYWSDKLLTTWLKLGRASYYNSNQQAGQLFNRGTAIEAMNRRERLAPLEFQASICDLVNRSGTAKPCFINSYALQQACEPGGRTPPPDYLVLASKQPERALGEWVIRDPVRGEETAHYYLHRCADLVLASASAEKSSR